MKRSRLEDSRKGDLSRLAKRCGELKRRLVDFTYARYAADVVHAIRQGGGSETRAVDDFIHGTRLRDGRHLIERFVEEENDLGAEDAELVLGWQKAFTGVFRLEAAHGLVVEATNLVDDLEYTLFATLDSPEIRRTFGDKGCFILSRIAPVGELWMLSGNQRLFPKQAQRVAYGVAATLAISHPGLFFRNPSHLERGRAQDREQHERFLEMFGAHWVVGTPQVIEKRWFELMIEGVPEEHRAKTEGVLRAQDLPQALKEAETVGMISDPDEGLSFLKDFGRFLSALHDPKLVGTGEVREVVLGYLEGEGCVPTIFSLLSRLRPVQLGAMLAVLLERPGFTWATDGEALLRERNPAFFETPRYPTKIPMGKELADGLRYLNALEAGEEPPATDQPQKRERPKKGRRKKAKKKRGCR